MRGKPNPLLKIGKTDHGNREGEEIWALRDINFSVEQGEVLGIPSITLRAGIGRSETDCKCYNYDDRNRLYVIS